MNEITPQPTQILARPRQWAAFRGRMRAVDIASRLEPGTRLETAVGTFDVYQVDVPIDDRGWFIDQYNALGWVDRNVTFCGRRAAREGANILGHLANSTDCADFQKIAEVVSDAARTVAGGQPEHRQAELTATRMADRVPHPDISI